MAQRAGKALREQWADEAYAARPCRRCGHAMGLHSVVVTEPPAGAIVDGQIVIKEAVYGAIACHSDDCECRYPNTTT